MEFRALSHPACVVREKEHWPDGGRGPRALALYSGAVRLVLLVSCSLLSCSWLELAGRSTRPTHAYSCFLIVFAPRPWSRIRRAVPVMAVSSACSSDAMTFAWSVLVRF